MNYQQLLGVSIAIGFLAILCPCIAYCRIKKYLAHGEGDDAADDAAEQKSIPRSNSGATANSGESSDSNFKYEKEQHDPLEIVVSSTQSTTDGVETSLASFGEEDMMESQHIPYDEESKQRKVQHLHICEDDDQQQRYNHRTIRTKSVHWERPPQARFTVQSCHSKESRTSIGTIVSRLDVHVCMSDTCELCSKRKGVTFIEAKQLEPKMVNKLRSTGAPSQWWEFGVPFVDLYRLAQVRAAEKGQKAATTSPTRPSARMSTIIRGRGGGGGGERTSSAGHHVNCDHDNTDDASSWAIFSRTAPQDDSARK